MVPATAFPRHSFTFLGNISYAGSGRATERGRKGHSDLASTEAKAAAKEFLLPSPSRFFNVDVCAAVYGWGSRLMYSSFLALLDSSSLAGPESRAMPLVHDGVHGPSPSGLGLVVMGTFFALSVTHISNLFEVVLVSSFNRL